MRYQLYREHKYVSAALNDVERLIARTDFFDDHAVKQVVQAFASLSLMLKGHAWYENTHIHVLLTNKWSTVHQNIASDHEHQEAQLASIQGQLDAIPRAASDEERIALGYQVYLAYRVVVADNLAHINQEEALILPELWRLYTDEELRQIEAPTYHEMTPEQMVEMLQALFPYVNTYDRRAFLHDIRTLEPAKFAAVWQQVEPLLSEQERAVFTSAH